MEKEGYRALPSVRLPAFHDERTDDEYDPDVDGHRGDTLACAQEIPSALLAGACDALNIRIALPVGSCL